MNPLRPAVASGPPPPPPPGRSDKSTEPSSSSGSVSLEPRRHVSVACEACKQRRRKCSQNQPCDSCVRQNIPCIFAEGHDGRRREARKRKVQDLQGDSDLLKELFESLRGSKKEEVDDIVSLIRSNAPDEEIRARVRQEVHNIRLAKRRLSPDLERLTEYPAEIEEQTAAGAASKPSTRSRVLDIARLTDNPPYWVAADSWTSATDDDLLVSNLVSLWITWDRQFYHWIDLDPFLRDMKGEKADSEYCSPFLVNALLACACPLSDYDETRTKRGVTSDLMFTFFEEAKRLLEEVKMKPSIPTAQGLAMMFQASSMMGHDALGFEYLQSAAAMCQYLERASSPMRGTEIASNRDPLFTRALDTTCWGIFNYIMMVQLVYQRPPEMLPPSRPVPSSTQDKHQWMLYPQIGEPRSSFAEELLHQCSFLSIIVRDIGQLLWGNGQKQHAMLEPKIFQLHDRLQQWHASLPNHLLPHENSPPSVLLDLCYYQSLVLTLFTPLKEQNEHVQAATAARATEEVRNAALEIVRICRLWQRSFGTSHTNVFLTQPIYLALDAFINDERDNCVAEIVDLCIFFRAMTRRWPFAMAAFRMFQVTAQQLGKLPAAADSLFEEFQNRDWRDKDWQGKESDTVNSSFPVLGDGLRGDRQIHDLNDFFAAMEDVNIDSPSPKGKGKSTAE